jgi:hypothetical protein
MMKNLGLRQCWRCIHPVGVIRKSGYIGRSNFRSGCACGCARRCPSAQRLWLGAGRRRLGSFAPPERKLARRGRKKLLSGGKSRGSRGLCRAQAFDVPAQPAASDSSTPVGTTPSSTKRQGSINNLRASATIIFSCAPGPQDPCTSTCCARCCGGDFKSSYPVSANGCSPSWRRIADWGSHPPAGRLPKSAADPSADQTDEP